MLSMKQLPLAVHNRNYVINNIPADLCIESKSASWYRAVLKQTLSTTVVRNVAEQCHSCLCKSVWYDSSDAGKKLKGNVSPGLAGR